MREPATLDGIDLHQTGELQLAEDTVARASGVRSPKQISVAGARLGWSRVVSGS